MFKRLLNQFILARVLVALLAVTLIGVLGSVAQWAPNSPNIGGNSYCSSQVNGVCVNTVPAGPAVSGIETVPADTNASGGQAPQSARLTAQTLGLGTLDYSVPVTGGTVTALYTTRQIIVEPAGTIAALTVVFPASTNLLNGQRLGLCGTQIVTTLTMTAGSGTTISNGATAMLVPVATGAASCMEWIYRTANTTWYRVQ